MRTVVLVLRRPSQPEKDLSWKSAKNLLGNGTQFINELRYLHENWADDIMNMPKQKTSKFAFKQADVVESSIAFVNSYE
jgi:hypothetical protein